MLPANIPQIIGMMKVWLALIRIPGFYLLDSYKLKFDLNYNLHVELMCNSCTVFYCDFLHESFVTRQLCCSVV